MPLKRSPHSAQRQARSALAAVQERQTVHELAAAAGLPPTPRSQGQPPGLEGLPELCASRGGTRAREAEALPEELYQESGRRKMERAWVQKTAAPFDHRHARADGAGPSSVSPPAAVGVLGAASSGVVRRAGAGNRRPREAEARDRRPLPPHARLWPSAPDGLAVPGRVSRASPAGAAAAAPHGAGGERSPPPPQPGRGGPARVSRSASGRDAAPAAPGLACR